MLTQEIEELLVVSISIRTRTTLKLSQGKALIAAALISRVYSGGTVKYTLQDENGSSG
jgi:hypothetical protein